MSSEIIRIHSDHYERHITIDIDVIESGISNEGFRLWAYIFSRPKDWTLNRSVLEKMLGSAYKVEQATAELKALGLLIITPIREKGRWAGHSWRVKGSVPAPDTVQPAPVSPYPVSPDLDTPDTVRPDPVSQDALKETPGVKETEELTLQSLLSSEHLTPFQPSPTSQVTVTQQHDPERQARKAMRDTLYRDLLAAGVAGVKANELMREHGMLACRQQLDWLPYREKIDNPGGYLPWAIRTGAPAPKGLPVTVKAKTEKAESASLMNAPVTSLDSTQLRALGCELWPAFLAAVEAGLSELTVAGPPHPLAPLEAGIYPIRQEQDAMLYIAMPNGQKRLMQPQLLPLFNWPGKGVGVAA